ncbi:hypothetical protein PV325_008596 [Microctonus aethiopoides]|nr:hypothetical protein PV325_008596 [Microctonus aethiopoides]
MDGSIVVRSVNNLCWGFRGATKMVLRSWFSHHNALANSLPSGDSGSPCFTPHVGRIFCDVHSSHSRRVVERSYVLLMYLTIDDGTPTDVRVSAMVECVTESKALATSSQAMNNGVNVLLAILWEVLVMTKETVMSLKSPGVDASSFLGMSIVRDLRKWSGRRPQIMNILKILVRIPMGTALKFLSRSVITSRCCWPPGVVVCHVNMNRSQKRVISLDLEVLSTPCFLLEISLRRCDPCSSAYLTDRCD